ncbi:hypothetical protein [Lysinibacillus sphaericus]|nr:hypothetical protein [Lysinibacillus sphaericus]
MIRDIVIDLKMIRLDEKTLTFLHGPLGQQGVNDESGNTAFSIAK